MPGDPMPPDTAPPDLTITCYVRPALVLDPIDAKIETLRTAEREGRIDSLLLRSWPGDVALVDDTPHPEVLEQYDRFERWADRAGVTISPAFQTRETTSLATDRTVERLVTPSICLACHDGDRLVGVFPHTDGETTHTVPEAIAALRTGSLPEPLVGRESVAERTVPRPVSTSDDGDRPSRSYPRRSTKRPPPTCPDCGTGLTNVQGILDCGSCEWVGADRTTALVAGR